MNPAKMSSTTPTEAVQRFQRPPRLRFRSKALGEAKSGGIVFPHQGPLNPEDLIDYFPLTFDEMNDGGESGSEPAATSIRAAFSNMYDVYSIYQSWRASQAVPSVSDPRMLWRQAMLMIASALDTDAEKPLTRVICWCTGAATAPASATGKESGDGAAAGAIGGGRGVVIDIEDIKRLPPTSSESRAVPVIFVRFAELAPTAGPGGIITKEITKSMSDLPAGGLSRTICCTPGEIDHVLHILREASGAVDGGYRKKWEKKNRNNGKLFQLSMLRPPLKPSFPLEEAEAKRRAERAARKEYRRKIREDRDKEIAKGKAESKKQTQVRRKLRASRLEEERKSRMAVVMNRKANGEAMNRMCHMLGCEEVALIQCSQCKQACYCQVKRKSSPTALDHLIRFPCMMTSFLTHPQNLRFPHLNLRIIPFPCLFRQTNRCTGKTPIDTCARGSAKTVPSPRRRRLARQRKPPVRRSSAACPGVPSRLSCCAATARPFTTARRSTRRLIGRSIEKTAFLPWCESRQQTTCLGWCDSQSINVRPIFSLISLSQ
jgi:hypothetical protein